MLSTVPASAPARSRVWRLRPLVAFAAGADISEFEQRRSSESAVREYEGLVDAAQHAIEDSDKPVIALIHGFCIGGGVETALACDLRYASASSQFAIPAARLGVGYGVHALAMGLVNRVVPDAELDSYVGELALQLAGNAPLTIAASKSIINALIEAHGDFTEADALVARCMASADYQEGRRAFMEKRAPRFKGK